MFNYTESSSVVLLKVCGHLEKEEQYQIITEIILLVSTCSTVCWERAHRQDRSVCQEEVKCLACFTQHKEILC